MHPNKVKAAMCCVLSSVCLVVLAKDPEPVPWLLPTYKGDKVPLQVRPAQPAPQLPDSRELFSMALKCWPAPSHFRGEMNLESRINSMRSTYGYSSSTLNDTGLVSGLAGIAVEYDANGWPIYIGAADNRRAGGASGY